MFKSFILSLNSIFVFKRWLHFYSYVNRANNKPSSLLLSLFSSRNPERGLLCSNSNGMATKQASMILFVGAWAQAGRQAGWLGLVTGKITRKKRPDPRSIHKAYFFHATWKGEVLIGSGKAMRDSTREWYIYKMWWWSCTNKIISTFK